jgi:2-oxoisovalerate dehydrogenase E1 component
VSDRVAIVESRLDAFLAEAAPAERLLAPDEPLRPGSRLTARLALELFEDQAASRALDVAARVLKRDDRGFYTIGSSGHEQNVVLGHLLRASDPCFLHYRSGAFMLARARKLAGSTPVFDTLLSLCASAEDPTSGGRHKVWGSRAGWVPPQTSTIASHLPKAVGAAFALSRARRLGLETGLPADAIVCCSFGDASIQHATALSGINTARYGQRRGMPTPILFVCEDNKIGISVETPSGWLRETWGALPHLAYFEAAGDLVSIHDAAREAVEACRRTRSPVLLRIDCVRLFGHAGSDLETSYHTVEQIEATEEHDPLLVNARLLVESGAAEPATLRALVDDTRERVLAAAEEAARRPHLLSRAQVMAPLAPYDEPAVRREVERVLPAEERARHSGPELPELDRGPSRRTLAALLNAALADELLRTREMLVFGEDVGKKGGVYGLTKGLQKRFGPARVFDTLLDETAILGMAQGAAHLGFLPVPEIQYLAYVHNALDQLRGEACSLSFFSNGQFQNPMVVRIAGFGYQKGFGGHFHNDNSIGALRDIPGLMLAAPARGDDAVRMLRGALALARACGRVVCFLEPIALYHERDLFEPGDGGWLTDYPAPGSALLPGEVGVWGPDEADLVIVSYANGLRLALRAARKLEELGVALRVVDLRWLAPLPLEALLRHAQECRRVLVVDECRATGGGVADALIAALAERGFDGRMKSVRAADSYVPLGPAANLVLVSEDDVLTAAQELLL